MKGACKIVAEALDHVKGQVRVGMTGEEVDELFHDFIVAKQAYPSGEGFMGFPKAVCISTNDSRLQLMDPVLCHGVPNNRRFQEGDFTNLDITCYKNGFFGDTSMMVTFGEVDAEVRRMIEVAQQALYNAIRICKPGVKISEVAKAIEYRGC